MKQELRRILTNLLMSFEFARLVKTGSVKRIFAHVMVLIWGALADQEDILSASNVTLFTLRAWLLANVNGAWLGKVVMTEEDMDDAADLVAGGPRRGKYVEELYKKP